MSMSYNCTEVESELLDRHSHIDTHAFEKEGNTPHSRYLAEEFEIGRRSVFPLRAELESNRVMRA